MVNFTTCVQIVLLAFITTGCLSYSDHAYKLQHAVSRSQPKKAQAYLTESKKFSSQGKNRLLYYLEYAMIQLHLGNFSQCEKALLHAADLIDELYTVSISKTALSFVVNDSTQDYAGEEYEIVAVHAMLAMLYLKTNQPSKALVEARRINTRLRELSRDDQDQDLQSCGYYRDAFSLFLSGLIFEATKNYPSALIDYRRSLATYEGCYPGVSTPQSLVQSLWQMAVRLNRTSIIEGLKKSYPQYLTSQPKNLQQLDQTSSMVFIASGDPVTMKISESFVLATSGQIIRYSWPTIPRVDKAFPDYDVKLNNSSFQFNIVQNYDAIAANVLEQKRLKLTAKNITRLVMKSTISSGVSEVDPLLGFLLNIIFSFQETADTRSWALLPSKIGVIRIDNLPGGQYDLRYFRSSYSEQSSVKIKIKESDSVVIKVLDY